VGSGLSPPLSLPGGLCFPLRFRGAGSFIPRFGFWSFLFQVISETDIKDERIGTAEQRQQTADAVGEATLAGLKQLMRTEVAKATAKKKAAKREDALQVDEKARLANRGFIISFDNQLRSMGLGLKDFLPKRRLLALNGHQVRELVEVKCPISGEIRKRSVIRDTLSKEKVWELPIQLHGGRKWSPALHAELDQGSIGWPGINWVLRDLGIRGSQCLDRFHRTPNDWVAACTDAGLQLTRSEYKVALLLRVGPFNKGANHRVLVNTAKELFSRCDSSCPVYMHIYEAICYEMQYHLEIGFGSPEHREAVWQRLKSKLTGAKARETMKMSRWWSFEVRGRMMIHETGLYALVMLLVYLGWQRRWWRSFTECPLFDFTVDVGAEAEEVDVAPEDAVAEAEHGDDGAADGPAGDDGEAAEPPNKKHTTTSAKEAVKEMRKKCTSTMQFVSKILCRQRSNRLFALVCFFPTPVERWFEEELKAVKSRELTLKLSHALHQNAWRETLINLWHWFGSVEFATRLGFQWETDALWRTPEDDTAVAQAAWALLSAFIGHSSLTNLMFTSFPPYLFIGLCSEDEAVVKDTLQKCEKIWLLLQKLEAEAVGDRDLAAFVRDLVFPSEQWVREVLVALYEGDFQVVPPWLRDDMVDFATNRRSTLMCENLFRHVRGREQGSASKNIGPVGIWHHAMTCSLSDEFDRKQVEISELAKVAAPRVVIDDAFVAPDGGCSLERQVLDRITSSKPTWPTLSPAFHNQAALRWRCVELCDGSWGKIKAAWKSTLLQPGDLVKKSGVPKPIVVGLVTPYGIVGWNCDFVKQGELYFMKPDSGVDVCFDVVHDVGQWKVVPLMCCQLGSEAAASSSCSATGGLRVRATGKGLPLLTAAAKRGFRGMSVTNLKRLYKEFGLPGGAARPRTEQDFVVALARHVMPEISAEDLQEAHDLREALVSDAIAPASSLLIGETEMELIMEKDDADDEGVTNEAMLAFKVSIERRRKEKAKQHKDAVAKEGGDDALPPPPPLPPPALKPLPFFHADGLSQAEAKPYFPDGVIVRKDDKHNNRWSCTGTLLKPSVNKSWGDHTGLSQNEALAFCLQKCWSRHTLSTGEPCPWDLGALF
jgi:hypothetical protein